jgi:hypothetical protein
VGLTAAGRMRVSSLRCDVLAVARTFGLPRWPQRMFPDRIGLRPRPSSVLCGGQTNAPSERRPDGASQISAVTRRDAAGISPAGETVAFRVRLQAEAAIACPCRVTNSSRIGQGITSFCRVGHRAGHRWFHSRRQRRRHECKVERRNVQPPGPSNDRTADDTFCGGHRQPLTGNEGAGGEWRRSTRSGIRPRIARATIDVHRQRRLAI